MKETVLLSGHHLDYLQKVSKGINPEMPMAFGWPHAIRTILEKFEESGIDLTDASSEEEIVQLAAGRLGNGKARRRAPKPSALSCGSSASTRSGDRPANRSTPPEKDQCRSGRPPRSDHG